MFSIFSRSFTTASRLNGWDIPEEERRQTQAMICLLYTSDAADE